MKQAIVISLSIYICVFAAMLSLQKRVGGNKTPCVCEIGRFDTISVEDFIGRWYHEYIHDPENLDDNIMNESFELTLEKDGTQKNALIGRHFSSVRGGRKIDCLIGWEPSLHGRLRGDTLHLHFVSGWDVEGEAKLWFDMSARDAPALIWELDQWDAAGEEGRDEVEHYMPQSDTLRRVIETTPE